MNREGTEPRIYMYPLSLELPSHPGRHTTLSRVPPALQQVFVGYPFKYSGVHSLHPRLPNQSSPRSVSLFLFCK